MLILSEYLMTDSWNFFSNIPTWLVKKQYVSIDYSFSYFYLEEPHETMYECWSNQLKWISFTLSLIMWFKMKMVWSCRWTNMKEINLRNFRVYIVIECICSNLIFHLYQKRFRINLRTIYRSKNTNKKKKYLQSFYWTNLSLNERD